MLAENAEPTTQAVLSRDGTPIACERSGRGHPLILVDGALCSRTMGPSLQLARALEGNFTVFRYDRRGRGDSGDTAPYAVEREVDDIEAVLAPEWVGCRIVLVHGCMVSRGERAVGSSVETVALRGASGETAMRAHVALGVGR